MSPVSSWKIISVVSEYWKSSRTLGLTTYGKSVFSQRAKLLELAETQGNVCLGVVHMEEEVQDRVQVKNSKVKERHTERNKERNREAMNKRINRSPWMTVSVG